MKTTITPYSFRRAFEYAGRKDQFTYNGLNALFEYLEELEQDCGREQELDVIALCCDYCEYANLEEIKEDYTRLEDVQSLDDLRDHTTVIAFDGGIIICAHF